MKKRFFAIVPETVLIFGLLGCTSSSPPAESSAASTSTANLGTIIALRGADVKAPDTIVTGETLSKTLDMRQSADRTFDRNFEEQPPLVSHTVDEYPISLKSNGCLDCHSKETHKKENATVVPKSHFQTATGKTLSSLSSRRHFCVQCHVPQVNAKPLVANTFQGPK